MSTKTITLVTGANRGMGFEIAKELGAAGQTVILGSRDLIKGQASAKDLVALGYDAEAIQLDITNSESIGNAVKTITNKYGYLSILINNAGASFDDFNAASAIKMDAIRKEFDLNVFGTIDNTQQFIPLLKKSNQAKIINISSMMGSLANAMNPESSVYNVSSMGYQASKAAINMFTIQLGKEFKNNHVPITVNAIDPGLVATDFGGTSAQFATDMGAHSVEIGVARTIELATSPTNAITATFSNIDGEVAW